MSKPPSESLPSTRQTGMQTRGGAKEKMAAIVAQYRTGGRLSESDERTAQTEPKTKLKKKLQRKSKDPEKEAAAQKAKAIKLAELEDQVAKKAAAMKSKHPRRQASKQATTAQDSGAETLEHVEESVRLEDKSTVPSRQKNIMEMKMLEDMVGQPKNTHQKDRPKPRPAYKAVVPVAVKVAVNEASSNLSQPPEMTWNVTGGIRTRVKDTRSTLTSFSQGSQNHNLGSTDQVQLHRLHLAMPTHDNPESDTSGDEAGDEDSESDANNMPPPRLPVKTIKGKGQPKLQEQVLANHQQVLTKGFQQKLMKQDDSTMRASSATSMPEFSTPLNKKNISNSLQEWAQSIPPPPLARPSKKSKVSSASSVVTKIGNATATSVPSTKSSRSCAIVSKATAEVLGKPKKPEPKPTVGTKRTAAELDSDSNWAPTTIYGGLQDEDDIKEQDAASASPMKSPMATAKSKASIQVKPGISTPVKVKKTTQKSGNKELPNGALDNGRWAGVFTPTFLKYLGGINEDVWAMTDRKAARVLQAIWNAVYNHASSNIETKISHMVEQGDAVHKVATQRATQWRNSIGSAGLTVVNDFMDNREFDTTEERQAVAAELLDNQKYVFLKTKQIEMNRQFETKRSGRYRNPLILHTLAQHLMDMDGGLYVPGLFDDKYFPKAALVLSATAGYITYESYMEAKGTKANGIIKLLGPDGKIKKDTNFSKGNWEQESDSHILDVWALDDGRLSLIMAEATAIQEVMQPQGGKSKRKTQDDSEAGPSGKRTRSAAYRPCLQSDSDF
ncbi:hypothetical protein JOM56_004669 [Amanita muscaria]